MKQAAKYKRRLYHMKKFLSLILCLSLLAMSLPALTFAEAAYREPITMTVFSEVANFAGEQKGWFAKELKDRFNVTLRFVSTNVDANAYAAGVSAGELGDIINFGDMGKNFTTALEADLILDWNDVDLTPYASINAVMTDGFKKITDYVKQVNGLDGIWGFPYSVALQNNAWSNLITRCRSATTPGKRPESPRLAAWKTCRRSSKPCRTRCPRPRTARRSTPTADLAIGKTAS